MNKNFYKNCILKDRESRKFLDLSDKQWYADFLNLVEISKKCSNDIELQLETLFKNRKLMKNYDFSCDFSLSQEVLDYFIFNKFFMSEFLDTYKWGKFGNNEEYNMKHFPRENIPIIRMLDYFLKKNAFEHFSIAIEKLEYQYISIFFELTIQKIYEVMDENLDSDNLLYLFTSLNSDDFKKYFNNKYLHIIKNCSFDLIYKLVENSSISNEYISNIYFIEAFSKFTIVQQIDLIELMEDNQYEKSLTNKLRTKLNRVSKLNCKMSLAKNEEDDKKIIEMKEKLLSVIEMSENRLSKLKTIIENSSYFKKFGVENTELWKIISLDENYEIDLTIRYYEDIMNLYNKCAEYAKNSIVASLYPLNQLSSEIVHLSEGPFNILARVRTMWELKDLAETFEARTFCSFSILTDRNMSHFGNGVLYGYYSNVTPDLIAHIYPVDSLSNASATNEKELTDRVNMLLDIDDLNEKTFKAMTYNQLCIRTKTKEGNILWPDCIVCIDTINEYSKKIADVLKLKIVVLHKNRYTIENNVDIYKDLQ